MWPPAGAKSWPATPSETLGPASTPTWRPWSGSASPPLVGEFNGRLKGRDQYWNRSAGAEAILQARAAVLSEDGRLTRYFAERPGNPCRRRQPVP
ncbi:MAG TPA: hypothetical protein VMS17_17260 [Gemmataceae bacterium]|nr:hypothetical protein [Gemmataceae bacterium]